MVSCLNFKLLFFSFSGNDEKFKKFFENESIPNVDGAIVKVDCEVDFHSSIDVVKKEEDSISPPFTDANNVRVKEEKDFKFTPFIDIKKEEKDFKFTSFIDIKKEEDSSSLSFTDANNVHVKQEKDFRFTPFIDIRKEEDSSSLPYTDVNVKQEEEFISTPSIDIDVKKEEVSSCSDFVSSNCI